MTSPIPSISVVSEFQKFFPRDLTRVPPKGEVYFIIDIFPDTQPISIPPYRMTLTKSKELNRSLEIFMTRISFYQVSYLMELYSYS